VGTGPVRPVSGGTGPARYMNRSGSHLQTVPKIFTHQQTGRFDRFTGSFLLNSGNRPSTVLLTLDRSPLLTHVRAIDYVPLSHYPAVKWFKFK
jgi:hypothetical protein